MTTQQTLRAAMLQLTDTQRGKVYHVADVAKCPLWLAYDALVSEEWDEDDAIIDLLGGTL